MSKARPNQRERRDVVVRLWSARTSPRQLQAYLQHFNEAVLPSLRRVEGYHGAMVLTRQTDGAVEILVATKWQSLEAIRQFAGEDIEAAVVSGEAAALLSDFDRRVRHFELAMSDTHEASEPALPGR